MYSSSTQILLLELLLNKYYRKYCFWKQSLKNLFPRCKYFQILAVIDKTVILQSHLFFINRDF